MKKLLMLFAVLALSCPVFSQMYLHGPPGNTSDLYMFKDGSTRMTGNLPLFVVLSDTEAPPPVWEGELIFSEEFMAPYFSYTNENQDLTWGRIATFEDVDLKVSKAGDTMTGSLSLSGNNPCLYLLPDIRLSRNGAKTLSFQTWEPGEDPYYLTRIQLGSTGISLSDESPYLTIGSDCRIYRSGSGTLSFQTLVPGEELTWTTAGTFDASGFSYTETDPCVGAVAGIVKADGAGNISAAVSGTDYAAVSATSVISSGSGAPSTTPGKVGDIYVDTAGGKLYFAKGSSSSSDWILAGPSN